MDQGRVTVSYARALLQWANENSVEEEVYEQSAYFVNLLNNPDFAQLLTSPMINASKSAKTIQAVVSKATPKLARFVSLVQKNNREKQLTGMMLSFQKLYRDQKGIIRTRVESPTELSPSSKNGIKQFIGNSFKKEVELEFSFNPSLIGGFVLTIEDNMLDKSVKGELEKLRKKLMGIVQ